MRIFGPGEVKVATAFITVNPTGLDCSVELFLGPNDTVKSASSGMIPFTSTGAPQPVTLQVTMPTTGGVAYHVYLDVFVGTSLIIAYVGTEDIVIPTGSIGPIEWG